MLFDCLLTNFAPLEHLESLEPLEPFEFDLGLNFPELEDFDSILPDVNGIINDEPNLLDDILQSCTSPESLINLDDIVDDQPKSEEVDTESEKSQLQGQPQVEPPKCSPIKLTIWRTSNGLSCKLGSKETVKKTKKTEESQTAKIKKYSGKGKCKMLESRKTETGKKIKSQSQKRIEPQKRPEPPKRSESQKRLGESKETSTVKAKHSSAEPSAKKKISQPVAKPIKKEAETKHISDRIKTKLQDTKKRTITVIPALPEDPTKKKRGRKPKVDSGKLRLLQSIQIDHDYCLTPIAAPNKQMKVKKNLPVHKVESGRTEMKSKSTETSVTKMDTTEKSVPSIQKTENPATKVKSKPVDKIVPPIQKTENRPKVTKPLMKVEVPIQKTEIARIKPAEEKISTPIPKIEKVKVEVSQDKIVPQKIETAKVEPVEKSVPAIQKTETPVVPEVKEGMNKEQEIKTPAPKQKSISLQSYFKRKAVDLSNKPKYEMCDIYYLSTNTGNPGHCEVGFHSIAYPIETIKKIRSVKQKTDSGCQTDITLQSILRKPRAQRGIEESVEPTTNEPMSQGHELKSISVKQIIEKPTEEIIPVIKIDEESTPNFIPVIQIEEGAEEERAVAMSSSNNNKQISNQNLSPSEPAAYSSAREDDCSSRGSSAKRKRRDSSRSSRSSSSDSDDRRRYRRKSRRSTSPSSERRRRLDSDCDREYYSRSCDSRSSNYSSASSSRLSSPNYRASVYSSNSSRSSSNSPYYSDNSKRSYNSSGRRDYREPSYSSRSNQSESRYRESRRSDYEWKRRREEEEERKATEERRVVYVGNLAEKTTRDDLYDNFRTFGPIECIRLRFKPDGHNYGFVTYKDRKDAFDAIEDSKKDKSFPYKEVSFGGRRAFCQREYSDLDGRKAYAEERHNGRTNDNDDDFSTLLKKYAESQKRQRS